MRAEAQNNGGTWYGSKNTISFFRYEGTQRAKRQLQQAIALESERQQ